MVSAILDRAELIEQTSCPLCGGDRHRIVQYVDDMRHHLAHSRGVAQCSDCEMVYLLDRVPQSRLGDFYPDNYITNQTKPVTAPPGRELSRRDKLFNFTIWDREQKKVRSVERFVKPTAGQRLLDVGTGPGLFLSLARKAWECEVRGNDFSPLNARAAREEFGVPVDACAFADARYDPGSFDLVTMWHYLEHDYQPRTAVRRSGQLLRENGWLVLEVPNYDSFERRLFGRYWYNFDCPRHVQFFTPHTITKLLESEGFEVQGITYPVQAVGWSGSLQHLLHVDLGRSIRSATAAYLALLPASLLGRVIGRNDWMTVAARKR